MQNNTYVEAHKDTKEKDNYMDNLRNPSERLLGGADELRSLDRSVLLHYVSVAIFTDYAPPSVSLPAFHARLFLSSSPLPVGRQVPTPSQ